MAEKEQVKPLAAFPPGQSRSDDDDRFLLSPAKLRLQTHKYIKCCGCFAALLLILAVVGIVLSFTVLHIKNPNIEIDTLSFSNSGSDGEMIIVASVSVKNPNVASFKYSKTTTKIYYGGKVIGEGETPAGEAKAKETMKMNVTVAIGLEKIDDVSSLMKDLNSGSSLNINSYTKIPGRVKILGFIKKNLLVRMNCSMTYNTRSQTIQGENCNQPVEVSD
ncbi:uncharacterized protein LOC111015350 [Momordica charantia]|uniref:Uncharacterized protein LOC111015350 n=1 Tax=Momordica charantia TaxID=3673 RepID=A0A6J1CYE1_MOMCH|nr:uncharacterized protein LOC111015350 [Momordica charantia]